MLTVVLGGARSGKSSYAQSLCRDEPVVYIATAMPGDDAEMRLRIASHRAMRPATWSTIEEPLDVAEAVIKAEPTDARVIVDCVTVWISNLLWKNRQMKDDAIAATALGEIDRLTDAARIRDVIIVTNEVGQGTVPTNHVGRLFRDIQGFANQRLVRAADRAVLLVAGVPLDLKRGNPV